jgi:hypothetical protein
LSLDRPVTRFSHPFREQITRLSLDACVGAGAECSSYYNGALSFGQIGGMQWLKDFMMTTLTYFNVRASEDTDVRVTAM